MTVPAIRVLLVDDQELVRVGLRMILERAGDIEVVGEAANGADGVAATNTLHPDVVLMDVQMPVVDGLEAVRRLGAAGPLGSRIVMLTVVDREEDALAALRDGASGYLLKDVTPDEIVAAVRATAGGGAVLTPSVARSVLDRLPAPPPAEARRRAPLDRLTDRESDILSLVARGRSNVEIAAALFLSEGTVRTYLSRMLRKLGVRDRTQAAVAAYDAGLVHPRRDPPPSP